MEAVLNAPMAGITYRLVFYALFNCEPQAKDIVRLNHYQADLIIQSLHKIENEISKTGE